ncbi:MAG: HIT family protein [Streptococcaceae bacterium]|jgi:histidine triad (HIT) family protein|nr:HIT family protein [Streptococcaceae bacterium]
MADCIFCKIIAGEIPSTKIYEDEDVLAILDISQATKGHTLVMPKKHFENLLAMSGDEAALLFSKIPDIANRIVNNLGAEGMNVIANCGPIAGQSVMHTHIHLLPRTPNDGGPDFIHTPTHDFDLDEVAKEIIG